MMIRYSVCNLHPKNKLGVYGICMNLSGMDEKTSIEMNPV
jgi:hypothetical protein